VLGVFGVVVGLTSRFMRLGQAKLMYACLIKVVIQKY